LIAWLDAQPSGRAEAQHLLGRLVRAEPFRIESLRRLHQQADALDARAEATVSAQILSLFDSRMQSPAHRPFHVGLARADELNKLLTPNANPGLKQLLAMLWDNARAIPRFRRSLDAYEVGPRQRVSPSSDSPVAAAFARAARLLSRAEVPLYIKAKAPAAMTVVATHPPAIIARAELADEPQLVYRMAQSLVLADPEHAVLCVLPEQESRDLFAGMLGAFGPKEASAQLDRAGKELASVLWHTVPMRPQAQMRDLVAATFAELDYERLQTTALLAGHRAGLLALGNARLALETVASLEPVLHAVDVHTEEGFRIACRNCEAFAELVRTALSEPYFALVAQVL
jgi:hypothetical protein